MKSDECIFCGAIFDRSKGRRSSREHFWGRSLQNLFESEESRKSHPENWLSQSGKIEIKQGFSSKGGPPLNATIKGAVCAKCNSGWLSECQDRFSQIIQRYQKEEVGSLKILESDRPTIISWAASRYYLHSFVYPVEAYTHPKILEKVEWKGFKEVESQDRMGLYERRALPSQWRFALNLTPFELPDNSREFRGTAANLIPFTMIAPHFNMVRSYFLYLLHIGRLAICITNAPDSNSTHPPNFFLQTPNEISERISHLEFEDVCIRYFSSCIQTIHPVTASSFRRNFVKS